MKSWFYAAAMVVLIGKAAGTYDASWWSILGLVAFGAFCGEFAKSYVARTR